MVRRSFFIASAPPKALVITRGRSCDCNVDGEREEKQAHLFEHHTADEKDGRDAIQENDEVNEEAVVEIRDYHRFWNLIP